MSEPDNSSTTSNERKKERKKTLKIHGTIIMGALLVSIVGLIPLSSAVITISLLSPITTAAFATTINGGDITCDGQPATIIGTSRADNIVGTSGRDVVAALAGFDRVSGNGGDDLICGGSANDQLNGGDGDDRIIGDSGNDVLAGDSGRDELIDNSGIDRANGGAGNDICNAESEISCDEPDTTAPTLGVPDDMRVFPPLGATTVVVTWEVTAQDNVDGTATLHEDNTLTRDNVGGDIIITCRPPSGTAFSVGVNSHSVGCTATDEAGNTATAFFGINTQL